MSPEKAADLVVDAVIHRPSRITIGMGKMFEMLNLLAPKWAARVMNIPFRMFAESKSRTGEKVVAAVPSTSK